MTARKLEKLCGKCNTEKSLIEFGNKVTAKDGKQLWCTLCANAYYRKWRLLNKNKSKPLEEKSFKNFYSTVHGRAVHMYNNMRTRTKKNDTSFDLTVEWIENKLLTGICEVTGIPFVIKENGGKGHKTNSFSPSIDRISQTGPYTQDNCQITCWIYNRAKGAFPIEDLQRMMIAIVNKSSN